MSARLFLRPLQVTVWIGTGLLAANMVLLGSIPALAQDSPTPEAEETDLETPVEAPVEDSSEAGSPSEVRRVTPVTPVTDSSYSIAAADQLTEEASLAIANQQYPRAIEKLTEARKIYNDLSTFYQELSGMFIGIDTRQTESNREKALETAQKRDQTTYQLALLYRAQDRPEQAVPLLIEILRSQQPTRELGQQAYQQLFELGFVEAPYEN